MKSATTLMIFAFLAPGCEQMQNQFRQPPARPAKPLPEPITTTAEAAPPPASNTPATQPIRTAVMATVNGKSIYMPQLIEPLLEAHGLTMAEMLIAHELVAQAAAKNNIIVTEADATKENELTLRSVFGDQLTEDQRDRMLTELLRQRGLTRRMWQLTMWRNAALRKMAAPRVKITEAMLQAEFARQYGQKVQISHIQLPSVTEAQKIIELLKQGQDFAELAKRYSTNTTTAVKGGLLPPFARDDNRVPDAIRQAAFSLTPGQISSIVQTENDFQVLKLRRRIAPPQVDYANVKEQLRQKLQNALIERMQTDMISRLRRTAAVEYVNPSLRKALRQRTNQPQGR